MREATVTALDEAKKRNRGANKDGYTGQNREGELKATEEVGF